MIVIGQTQLRNNKVTFHIQIRMLPFLLSKKRKYNKIIEIK